MEKINALKKPFVGTQNRVSSICVGVIILALNTGCQRPISNPNALVGRWQYLGHSSDAELVPQKIYKDITSSTWVQSEDFQKLGMAVTSGGTYNLDGEDYSEIVAHGKRHGNAFKLQM